MVPYWSRPLEVFGGKVKFKDVDRGDALGVCFSVICGSTLAILGFVDRERKREAMFKNSGRM